MKVGSLVLCINKDGWMSAISWELVDGPVYNHIYTVSGFPKPGYITLEEFPEIYEDGSTANWVSVAFKEIQPPMNIEIDSLIEETLEV